MQIQQHSQFHFLLRHQEKPNPRNIHDQRTVATTAVAHLVMVLFLVCFIHIPMCAHHDPASHVRVRNFWLSLSPNYLHNKLSSVVEGSAPAWSYYTVKYYRSRASEASGEEHSLVPIAGDPSRGWGLAGCQDAGAMGELWGRWEHVKACLSESRGSGVKVPSSPAAKHEWKWGNVHEYSIGCYLSLSTFLF